MVTYERYQPKPILQPFFQNYRSIQAKQTWKRPSPFLVFPDGAAHILFHLYKQTRAGETIYKSNLSLVGPRSIYKEINRQNRELTLIFSFKAAAAFSFLTFPLKEITDRSVPLVDIMGGLALEWKSAMTDLVIKGEIAAAVKLLEEGLTDWVLKKPLRYAHPVLQRSLCLLDSEHKPYTIAELAAQQGVSTRYLHQLFTIQLGIGAKRFCQIQRVKKTLRQAQAGWSYGWADLANDNGYYDQSHMIDEFQSLLGTSPGALIGTLSK